MACPKCRIAVLGVAAENAFLTHDQRRGSSLWVAAMIYYSFSQLPSRALGFFEQYAYDLPRA
jgi:hypothetical protein